MKKEHYEHVVEHFDIGRGFVNKFLYTFEHSKSDMLIAEYSRLSRHHKPEDGYWCISDVNIPSLYLFIQLPSLSEAQKIIRYIKDTEILFI